MNGTIRLTLRPDLKLTAPVAETPTHLITTGFAATLDQAFRDALNHMVDLLVAQVGLTAAEAYCLCSLSANFRVTQVVNAPPKGDPRHDSQSHFPPGIVATAQRGSHGCGIAQPQLITFIHRRIHHDQFD